MKINYKAIILSIFLVSVLSACGSSTARLLTEGNQAFEQQAFEAAMNKYNQAAQQSPFLAEPIYNLANALYRLDSYQEASTFLKKAVEIASDELSEFSYFNLGNSFFQRQNMEEAITAYQEALRKNPNDLDAKYNLELALQQQSEQAQNDQQQTQDQQQDGSDSQNQQDQQNEQNQNPENAQNQTGEEENQQNSNNQDSNSQNEESQNNQETASNQNEEGSQDQASNQASGSNTTAENDETDQESSSSIQGLTEEQARQILAAIANGSKTLQEKLQEIFSLPLPLPEKDW